MASGTQNMTTDKARILSTSDGTAKFWRSDNSWSSTLTNTLTVKNLIISNTDQVAHIDLSRTSGPNYINVPASSSLAFSIGGATGTKIIAAIKGTSLQPWSDLQSSLGTSSERWNTLYTKTVSTTHFTTQITGTQTAQVTSSPYQSALWKFNLSRSATSFSTGETIMIKTPGGGGSQGVFISFDNGATYRPICVSGTGRLTTHFTADVTLILTYDSAGQANGIYGKVDANGILSTTTGTNNVGGGCWRVLNLYDSGNTNDSAGYIRDWGSESIWKVTGSALYRYMLLLPVGDGLSFIPANASSNTQGTGKTNITTSEFSVFEPIIYYSHTDTISSGGTIRNDRAWYKYRINIKYSFNCGDTLTAGKDVYLVCVLQSTGKVKLRNPGATGDNAKATATGANAGPITQTLPSSDDGYLYKKLGKAYSTNCFSLDLVQPVYWYKDGQLQLYSNFAAYTTYINSPDTRSVAINPNDLKASTMGVRFDFKQKSISGLTANYSGIMSYRPYASGSDWSGGPAHQLAFDPNGLHWRKSTGDTTWGNWEDIAFLSSNVASATKATQDGSGNTITSYYCTLSTAQTISGTKTHTAPIAMSGATGTITFTANNTSTATVNTPTALSYSRLQSYGPLYINADTDGSTSEYCIITSGRGMSNSTADGLAIGYNTLQWMNNRILTVQDGAYRSLRNFGTGTLIVTDIPGNVNGPAFYLTIEGNGYNEGIVDIRVQGYLYDLSNYSQYVNCWAESLGNANINEIYIFNNSDNKLSFWFGRLGYWHGYDIKCYNCLNDTSNYVQEQNHVISVTDSSLPSTRGWSTTVTVTQPFLRYRGSTSTDGEGTYWDTMGSKQYNNALPDGLSNIYQYGQALSFTTLNARLDIYAAHTASSGTGLWFRSGWDSDKTQGWARIIDSKTISSQSVNYANSAGYAGYVSGSSMNSGNGFWANQGVNGERQVGVESATSGNLYLFANTTDKGIYASSGYSAGYIFRCTSTGTTFYGTLSGNADTANYQNCVADNEIRYARNGNMQSAQSLWQGWSFAEGRVAVINDWRFGDGNGGLAPIYGSKVYNAVWNDFAEYRESDETEGGRVLVSNGSGRLVRSTERLQPAARVISDTFGCSVGQSDTARTPIGVAGRVLVFPYQNRENYKVGDAVCAAPNGTADIMTREEIIQYPDRIIGIVDEIPEYEIWDQVLTNVKYEGGEIGEQNHTLTPVNGRIWIYVR